jgi:hypothetical protein
MASIPSLSVQPVSSFEDRSRMNMASKSDQTPEDTEDTESMEEFRARLIQVIGQMMFVSGETAEPSAETTLLIEDIVRQQVIEMVLSFSLVSGEVANFEPSSLAALLWLPVVVIVQSLPMI